MRTAESPDLFLVDELLSDEERALREKVRAFCESEVRGVANDYWERAAMPFELIEPLAQLGIAGGTISGYGCPGLSPLADGMVIAELARADGSLSTLHGVHTKLAMTTIATLGSDEQRERWLPAMARMERLGAFALTEPEHGSDIVSLETRAHRDGDHWVLSGAKRWIGNGSVADVVIVWARDDDGDVGGFVVETPAEGFDAEVITGKTSNRALWQADLSLERVRVPVGNRLAGARTFDDTGRVLISSRQGVAWEALGHAVAAYEGALAYANRREQFGQPLASFQLVQAKLVDMVTAITTMQLLCVRMAELQAAGRMSMARASLAKRHNAAAARKVCADARDLLGGNGILLEHHVARHQADVEAVYTYEGSHAVQTLIVGRELTGLSAFT